MHSKLSQTDLALDLQQPAGREHLTRAARQRVGSATNHKEARRLYVASNGSTTASEPTNRHSQASLGALHAKKTSIQV
jgi:hypothetical protein